MLFTGHRDGHLIPPVIVNPLSFLSHERVNIYEQKGLCHMCTVNSCFKKKEQLFLLKGKSDHVCSCSVIS